MRAQPVASIWVSLLALTVAPSCRAFVAPTVNQAGCSMSARGRSTQYSSKHEQINSQHQHRGSTCAVPKMSASEFGGIQHAGVLVSDTKASKVG